MPDDFTLINNGNGDVSLGVVTNLMVSGYAKFGTERGTLFSPDGDQQISGSLITYRSMSGRGGIVSGNPAASNYLVGAFIRGSSPSGDAFLDASSYDYALLGSGLLLGPIRIQNPANAGATVYSEIDVIAPKLAAGGQQASDELPGRVLAIVGSGVFQGPSLFTGRPSAPGDAVHMAIPLYCPGTGGPPAGASRVLSSGELTVGGSYRIHSQTTLSGAVNTSSPIPVYSYDVPAHTISPTGGLEVEWFGHYVNNTAGQQDLSVTVTFGGADVAQLTLSGIAAHAGERAFTGRSRLTGAGSGGAQVGMTTAAVSTPATTSGIGSGITGGGVAVTSTTLYCAVDSTSLQTFMLKLQHGNVDPQLRVYVYNVMTRKL